MLRDRMYDYYIVKDFNCAESTLHAINDEYGLGIPDETYKLVGGFGGGMGCGNACGALCSCMAALGMFTIKGRAHATPDFKNTCANLVQRFRDRLGNTVCDELTKKYKKEKTRCLDTILLAADVFEEYVKEVANDSVPRGSEKERSLS